MDFSSFNLQDTGDLFKQNYQLNQNNNHKGDNAQHVDNSNDFFNFMDNHHGNNNSNNSSATTPHFHPTQQQHGAYSVPQLSPDGGGGGGHEGSSSTFTNSSVLSGHNPEFQMSPLQIASHPTTSTHSLLQQTYHTPLQHATMSNSHLEEFNDEEEFFTPLVSPAMAPTYNDNSAFQSLVVNNMNNNNHENIFSPLSSPALHPQQQQQQQQGDQTSLQQKLAFIERQQQQLRNMHNQLRPNVINSPVLNSSSGSNGSNSSYNPTSPLVNFHSQIETKLNTKKALQQKIAMSSPQFSPQANSPRTFAIPKSSNKSTIESPLALKPMAPHTTFVNKSPSSSSSSSSNKNNGFIAPATPSLLMKLGSGGSNTLSPSSTPTTNTSSGNLVDNMPILPAAMLENNDEYNYGANDKTTKKKNETAAVNKRRRISQSQQQQQTQQSPALLPTTTNDILASPLNGPKQSPRALKPLISPSLKPNGKRLSTIEEETARALLTSKSNYENLKEGKAKSLGIDFSTTIQSGIENRRSAHKAAEQKRRDTLKQSFDSLRTEIIDAMMEEELQEHPDLSDIEQVKATKEKDVKQMSKVVLLQHSYEYILRLKNDNKRKDEKQAKMRKELVELRKQLGLPEVTKEEQELEVQEKLDEKERRLARNKRLQTAAAVGAAAEQESSSATGGNSGNGSA